MVAPVTSSGSPDTTVETGGSDLKSSAKRFVGNLAENAKAKAKSAQQQAAEFAQRNPYQALAIACGIGFVAGLILKRR